MLVPVKDMRVILDYTPKIFENISWSIQTNLVYKLSDERRQFFKDAFLEHGFGASWDCDIRFANRKQEMIFEQNSYELNHVDGHKSTMTVSITKGLLEREPIDVMTYARKMGYSYILFERITEDGNAKESSVRPPNAAVDQWLLKMWDQCIEYKTYEWIGNMFMSEIAKAVVHRNHTANRCRNCEQSLLTINADGTIAGCPNSAPVDYWGHIDDNIKSMLTSKKRLEVISCETQRDPRCYTCPAFDVCNGDCHQLAWEGDICGAPKSLWKKLKQEQDYDTYRKMIIN
jgi:radical SAM protein with 4Fe4S-binding SPASM domain